MTVLRGLGLLGILALVPGISFAQCPQGFTLTGGVCVASSGGGSTSPGGSPGAIQINSAGAFGAANLTQNATDGSLLASKAIDTAASSAPTFNNAGTTTVDWSLSNFAIITGSGAGASTTIAFSNPHGGGVFWLQTINPASAVSWTVAVTGQCFPTAAGASTLQAFAYNGSAYIPGPCNPSVPGAFSAAEVGAFTATTGRGLAWFDSTLHLWCANNNASGTNTCTTPLGTSGDVIDYGTNGAPQDSGVLLSVVPRTNTANTFTNTNDYSTGLLTDQPFAPIINTSEATDKLTGNGVAQFFSINSGSAQIPANTLITGKKLTLHVNLDVVAGAATSSATIKIVLCTVSAACANTVVPVLALLASNPCINNTTCNDTLSTTCWGTAAAGASVTINCANTSGRVFSGLINTLPAAITGVPTNGILFVNVSYNQTAATGNTASLMSAWGTWDL